MNHWLRPHYQEGGGEPYLFYAVFGNFPARMAPLSAGRYRSSGLPAGLTLDQQEPDFFRQGVVWQQLEQSNPRAASVVGRAHGCLVLRGQPEEPKLLDYFRDTVGLLTYLLDQGGVALYDPFALRWWEPSEWMEEAFRPGEPRPATHVVILSSDEEPGVWLHTRGMRKFGRPDLSMRGLEASSLGLYAGLFRRLIEFGALGGIIAEGQEVRVAGLPFGLHCYHQGSLDDPDFNNVHIEIR